MSFEEVLDQAIEMLRRRGRVTYRALKRQFDLDEDYLEDLTEELIKGQQLAVDENGEVLVWAGAESPTREPTPLTHPTDAPVASQDDLSTPVEPPPADFHAPEAERRQLTVMFCDLVDSTALAGQFDPEDLRDIIRAYQNTSAAVIEGFEGTIAQHLGDGLLVYFGYPHAHEDDAQRAVRAGLGLLDAMGPLNTRLEQDHGIRLAVRIGIHTGPVVVGEIGGGARHEQLALGETPNIAARLEGFAAPNTVAISAHTQRLVGGAFDLSALGVQTLKGVAAPMPLYRVHGESDAESRFEAATVLGLTPLVGREEELGLVLRRWEQAKESEGQVVLLCGEPGIGKSRLTQAMREQVAHESHGRLRYQCSPYYTQSALYPIIAQIERAAQLTRDDTIDQKLDKLETLLGQGTAQVADVAPLFAALLAIPTGDRYPSRSLTPQRQKEQTIEALVAQLVGLARQQPVLFIWEDAHWSDPTSLEVLDVLIPRVAEARVLVIITYRPEFAPPWSGLAHVTTHTLNRMTRRQATTLVAGVTGGKALPDEVLDQIVAKTDGVPLFVEELTKTVLEAGFLRDAGDHYALDGPLPPLAIPSTLHDSLMARLDQMHSAKEVAQLGAVIGREFSYTLIHAIWSQDVQTLQEGLAQLVAADLLSQRGRPSRATYIFKHALIQDSAYTSLLRSTRQQVHRHLAQRLETQFSEIVITQPELAAHHYTEGNCPEQAIDYWEQAGRRAAERSANAEAITHLTKGLAVLTTLPATPERAQRELAFHMALVNPITSTKGWMAPELEQSYTRAYALCQDVGEIQQRLPVLLGLVLYYHTRADYRSARELEEEALDLAEQDHDETSLLLAHLYLGTTLCNLAELIAAREHLERGIQLYNPDQHQELAFRDGQDPKVLALCWQARTLWLLGYPDQAQHCSDEALAWVQALSHIHSRACALGFTAVLHHIRREYAHAQELAEALMVLSEEQGFTFWVEFGYLLQGWQRAMEQDNEAGIDRIQQSVAAYEAIGFGAWRSHFLSLIAEAYVHGGHVDAGLRVLAEASALVNRTEERWWEAELYRLQGDFLLQADRERNEGDAEACLLHALHVARQQQARSLELRSAVSLGRLWLQQGRRSEAGDLMTPIYSWFTEGFDTVDLLEAQRLLDELHA